LKNFKTENEAIQFFIKQRWNGKVECPYKDCKPEGKVYEFKDGKRFQCSYCDRIFSYKTGTLFENTKIPLKKWFLAMYIHTSHKKGISSLQLAKDINVTQKTAWFMLQRINLLGEL
jgi:transposase-like protein